MSVILLPSSVTTTSDSGLFMYSLEYNNLFSAAQPSGGQSTQSSQSLESSSSPPHVKVYCVCDGPEEKGRLDDYILHLFLSHLI